MTPERRADEITAGVVDCVIVQAGTSVTIADVTIRRRVLAHIRGAIAEALAEDRRARPWRYFVVGLVVGAALMLWGGR